MKYTQYTSKPIFCSQYSFFLLVEHQLQLDCQNKGIILVWNSQNYKNFISKTFSTTFFLAKTSKKLQETEGQNEIK